MFLGCIVEASEDEPAFAELVKNFVMLNRLTDHGVNLISILIYYNQISHNLAEYSHRGSGPKTHLSHG